MYPSEIITEGGVIPQTAVSVNKSDIVEGSLDPLSPYLRQNVTIKLVRGGPSSPATYFTINSKSKSVCQLTCLLFFLGNSISLEWFICEFREKSRMLHLWFILPDQIPLLLPLLQSLQQQRLLPGQRLLLHPHRKPPSQLEAQRQPLQLRRHQKQRHNRMVLKSPGFHHPCSILYSQLH